MERVKPLSLGWICLVRFPLPWGFALPCPVQRKEREREVGIKMYDAAFLQACKNPKEDPHPVWSVGLENGQRDLTKEKKEQQPIQD